MRVQRKRIKGWKMPENTVYVGRPTKWGNPYSVKKDGRGLWTVQNPDGSWRGNYTSEESAAMRAVILYQRMMETELNANPYALDELRGHDLACWCRLDHACHVDVLIELLGKMTR